MRTVNMLEAKTHLSRLVKAVERGEVEEIVLARAGRPIARIVPLAASPSARRIGVAKERFEVPDDIDASNEAIAHLFGGAGN